MNTVAIRVDASTKIGTGHVRRMLSLATTLREREAQVWFVTRELGLDSAGLIAAHGFDVISLDQPGPEPFAPDPAIPHAEWGEVPIARDADETVDAIVRHASDTAGRPDWAPDWVIVDSYAVDARWHRRVAQRLGTRMAVIDDLADRPLEGDLVIDHNFHPDSKAKFAGRLPGTARLLAGPAYAMIDPLYAQAPRYDFHGEVRSIGLFLGGVDAGQHTAIVLDALDKAGWKGPVEVVSTSANPNLAALEYAAAQRPGTRLSLDLPNLAGFLSRHDLQIGAGGGASWERCCIGPPTIALVCAPNQRLSVPFLDEAGVVAGHDLLDDSASCPAMLAQLIAQVIADPQKRCDLHRKAMALVDGKGAARVANAIVANAQAHPASDLAPSPAPAPTPAPTPSPVQATASVRAVRTHGSNT